MEISDRELRERLLSYGCNPPPVTDNSRVILLKKLRKLEGGSDNLASLEPKVRKSKQTRNQDPSPEKYDSLRKINSDVSRLTNSRKDLYETDFDVKKIKNSTPLVLVEKYKHDPFEKGSDSDDSYCNRPNQTASHLARKPLSVRRDTEFYSAPTAYIRKYDFDNGVSSYLNRNMHRGLNASTKSNGWTKKFSQVFINISTSSVVLLAFMLFFIVVGYIYYSQNDQMSGELSTDLAEKPLCSKKGKEGISCVMDADMDESLVSWRTLYRSLYNTLVKANCNGDKATSAVMKYDDAVELLTRELNYFRYEAEKHVMNIIVLVKYNPKFKVTWSDTNRSFYLENPELPWSCALKQWFYVLFEYAFSVLLAIFFIISMHILFRYIIRQRQERNKGTQELIKGILDILQQNAIANPSQNFMPIVHVREQLISYADREHKKNMWADAVKDVEQNESRVRKEVQMYQGEDYDVWRWVAGHQQSTPKPKTWQGEAFETSKDNMNTPSTSPTPCLKIRHMFNPKNETEEEDWVTVVKDAILERCEGINIVHISVDEASPDGCVYIKCASTEDAGKAYRKIHGAWFDGKIISVKYLRLERYHERFPNSVNHNTPLVPSNDQKRSIV